MVTTVDSPVATASAGSTVCIAVEGDEEVWTLVPAYDADWREGRLSTDVPLGAALLGRRAGDTAVVRGPKGQYKVAVVDVR